MFPRLGFGLGLRPVHYSDVIGQSTKVDWFEVVSENYMGIESGSGGSPIIMLEKVRQTKPVVLHGVSLNIGSTDPLNFTYLKKLKMLAQKIEPAWISDHICWTGVNGANLHDLFPLPYTQDVIKHVVDRILYCQDYLGRRMIFENVSSYLTFAHSEMTEWEFLSEIAVRADCGLLLDINNVYVSSVNHGFNPLDFIAGVPVDRVAQIHLAGHTNMGTYLIDTHDEHVCDDVWNLYADSLKYYSHVSTMVEWDSNLPSFDVLQNEILKAKALCPQ